MSDNINDPNDKNLTCSFRGKNRNEVKKLIAGSNAYICNECISINHKIINDENTIDDLDFEVLTSDEINTVLIRL